MSSNIPGILYATYKRKGLRATYNKVYFYTFWNWIRRHPSLINLMNRINPYPRYIEVEVTTRCPLRCTLCEHTYWNEPGIDMTLTQFKYIVDQFPDLKWIGLTGIGESFVNKEFLSMLEYVTGKGVIVELLDNFVFINDNVADKLLDMQIDTMYVSLDAATKETYEKIRVNANFDKVVANIRSFIKKRADRDTPYPDLGFHYVICKDNVDEMVQYLDLVYDLVGHGTKIQFSRMMHRFKEVDHLYTEVGQETIDRVNKRAREIGHEIIWATDIPETKPEMSRCLEWTMPFIFINGDVIACCAENLAGDRQFKRDTSLGNIFKTPFREIWAGEQYRALREGIRNNKSPLCCAKCPIYEIKR